jgi:hypothetical protein
MSDITISRAGPRDLADAWAIVSEYYEAVDVAIREDLLFPRWVWTLAGQTQHRPGKRRRLHRPATA